MARWNFVDITGQRFGRYTVVRRVENDKRGKSQWLCKCDCGVYKVVGGQTLKNGTTQSCGCLHKDNLKEQKTTHGLYKTRIYRIYYDIKMRCYNPNNDRYNHYGGRGITVCDEWQEFIPFYDWAMANGYKDDLTIDRIDNDKGYSPDNCRWITNKEQQNNKRNNHLITYNGKTQTLQQWADEKNIKFNTIIGRLDRGYSIEEALTKPIKRKE